MQFLSSLFGGKPLAVLGVLIALVVVVAVVVFLVRALSGHNVRAPGGRMRQQRLGVVDAFDLDRQRQLVLIRRDNVEHLVMIGGPNDVLLESAIIRQPAANANAARTEPAAPSLPSASPPAIGASRPPANGLDPRSEFEPPQREPALAAAAGLAPPVAQPSASGLPGPRMPFPPRVSAPSAPAAPPPQRAPALEAPREPASQPTRPSPQPQPQPQQSALSPPQAPPVVAPPARPGPVRAGPPPRPLRPFPTLRAGGGPLFPVRPASPADAGPPPAGGPEEPAGSPPAESPAPPAKAATTPNVLDSFESLEEEMAKLLGRPGPGQS